MILKQGVCVKNMSATFSFSITMPVEYSSARCKLRPQNSLILQVFFAQGKPHEDFHFEVSTDETES